MIQKQKQYLSWCIMQLCQCSWLKLSWRSHGIQCMAEREAEDYVQKQVVFDCSSSFCMSLDTSLYGAVHLHLMLKV